MQYLYIYYIDTFDNLTTINPRYVRAIKEEFNCADIPFVKEDFNLLVKILSQFHGLDSPDTIENAINLFCQLLDIFE